MLASRSYDLLFIGDAITAASFGAIALTALPHGTRTTKHDERHLEGTGRIMARDTGFLLFLGAVFLTASVYMQNATTFALHVKDLGYSAQTYGFLQAGNGACGAVRVARHRVDAASQPHAHGGARAPRWWDWDSPRSRWSRRCRG